MCSSIICIDENGKILLGRRNDNHLLGYSDGSLEIDECVEDCAKRELLEEMGIIAEELEFFCVNSGPQAHYIYPNGDEVSNFEIVYLCRKWSGVPNCSDGEMDELRFYDPKETRPRRCRICTAASGKTRRARNRTPCPRSR